MFIKLFSHCFQYKDSALFLSPIIGLMMFLVSLKSYLFVDNNGNCHIYYDFPYRKLMTWWQTRSIKSASHRRKSTDDTPDKLQRWEADYQLLPYTGLHEEYLEMGIGVLVWGCWSGSVGRAPVLTLVTRARFPAEPEICRCRF